MCVARRLARLLVHPRGPAGRAGGVVWSATLTHSAAGGAAPAHARPSTPSNTATPATEETQLVHVIKQTQTIDIHTYIHIHARNLHTMKNCTIKPLCSTYTYIYMQRVHHPLPHPLPHPLRPAPKKQARTRGASCMQRLDLATTSGPTRPPSHPPRITYRKKKISKYANKRSLIKQESERTVPPPPTKIPPPLESTQCQE